MRILLSNGDFNLHINKGFGEDYYVSKRKKMGQNLSQTNIKGNMGVEYLKSENELIQEYIEHQKNSFDINEKL